MEEAARKHGLDFPHFLDNDYAYWKRLDNQYWPTVYLLDRCGRIRHRQVGEVHGGQASGDEMDRRIEALLAEPAGCR